MHWFQFGNEQIKLISDIQSIHLRAEQTGLIIGFWMSCDANSPAPVAAETVALSSEVCDLQNSPGLSPREALICTATVVKASALQL